MDEGPLQITLPLTDPVLAKARPGETLVLRLRAISVADGKLQASLLGAERFKPAPAEKKKAQSPLEYIKEKNPKPMTPVPKI